MPRNRDDSMDPSSKLHDDQKKFKCITLFLQPFVSTGPDPEKLPTSVKIPLPPPSVHVSLLHHALIL